MNRVLSNQCKKCPNLSEDGIVVLPRAIGCDEAPYYMKYSCKKGKCDRWELRHLSQEEVKASAGLK